MRVAYADPPYPGQAQRHYKDDPSGIQAAEVDHKWLIEALSEWFPDGWALSTSSTALQYVLSLCPPDVRIGAWVKPYAVFKPNINPAYCWEPVIFRGGRKQRSREELTVRDYVSANIIQKGGTHGSKPLIFSLWLFSMLGLQLGDEFYDLFPGSKRVSHAWELPKLIH